MAGTLLLMRHGKSGYPDDVADHDRPLAPRGDREAELAGDWIRERYVVDLVLCSTAQRTRETLVRTKVDAPVMYLDELYGASPGDVFALLNQYGADNQVIMVVGHDPAMPSVALLADPNARLTRFPTSAIAVLATTLAWPDFGPGDGSLRHFHVPH